MGLLKSLVDKFGLRRRFLDARLKPNILIFTLILSIGIFSRVWEFGFLPPGLNQDEASIGVEAYDLAHFGIDRNGISFPVNLISWGSGQNALYAYVLIPFVYEGLNPFTIRLPMLIAGIASLLLIYFVGNKLSKNLGLIAMFLLAICPWHIVLSRWGLESNLLPLVFIAGFACLLKTAPENKWFVAACTFFALCMYAYGTAYLAVTLFLVLSTPLLIIYGRLNRRSAVWGLLVFSLLAAPIFLFVFINACGFRTIHLGPVTIPRLPVQARFESVAAIFSGNPVSAIARNIRTMFALLFNQSDGLIWNSVEPYGYFYKITFPLAIFGSILLIPSRKSPHAPERLLLLIWLATSFAIGFMQPVNINRINLVFFPLLICIALFLEWLSDRGKAFLAIALCALLVGFVFFTYDYHGEEYRAQAGRAFFYGFLPALDYARQTGAGSICVTDRVEMPYIFVLFSERMNPNDYLNTIKYVDPQEPFREVRTLDRYTFGLKNCSANSDATIYVLSSEEVPDQGVGYTVHDFGNYRVYVPLVIDSR